MFEKIVGQSSVKTKLAFYVEGYRATKRIPTLMFVSERGAGKTTLAKAVADLLDKPWVEINCSSLKNLDDFMAQYIYKYALGREVTFILDEASEIPQDITMALLTILNPNPEGKTSFDYCGYKIPFDFTKISFFMCTTEIHKIFHALNDRCERIDLEPYTKDELGEIVKRGVTATIDPETLKEIVSVVRDNPRSAQKMSDTINLYVASKLSKKLAMEDWKSLQKTLGIPPLGLTSIELQILKLIHENNTCKLSQIAAKTGLTAAAIQRHFESHLLRKKLIRMDKQSGRALTTEGYQYIAALEEAQ